uniref:Transmembrane protein n=1 Tax=Kalanchoe fedtschenkoi TaxID=63787 RepID=A0A7N0ZTW0_KALFE
MAARWMTKALRWMDFDSAPAASRFDFRWRSGGFSWPEFSIVDDVLWSFVTVFESVALVSMLGFFFVFYGCTV